MDYFVLIFYIYSIIGWFVEVFYVGLVTEKRFYNRGFFNIPIIPIYGFGALIIISIVNNITVNLFLKFLLIVFLTSGLEYLTSIIMEYLFHTKWWDYSKYKYNLHGRICLRNSFLFGIGGLLISNTYQLFDVILLSLDLQLVRAINSVLLLITAIDLYFVLKKLVKLDIRDIHLFATSKKISNFHISYRFQAKIMSHRTLNKIFLINLLVSIVIFIISRNMYLSLKYFIALIFLVTLILIPINYQKHKMKKHGDN